MKIEVLPVLGWTLTIVLFLLAYAGLIIQVLPSGPFLLGGFASYSFLIGKVSLGWPFWISSIITVFILFFVVDWMTMQWSTKKLGGTTATTWASVAGMLLLTPWLIWIGPLAILIGPFIAVFAFECSRQEVGKAFKIALGSLLGLLTGALVKGFIMTMIIVWFFIRVNS